jgi:uncharacterized repeat protein (TIGR03803 family)
MTDALAKIEREAASTARQGAKRIVPILCAIAVVTALPLPGHAQNFHVVHRFHGRYDGKTPAGRLIADEYGNLYGTTTAGGAFRGGTIFKIAPDGTETILHSLAPSTDGSHPRSGVAIDEQGNLYGTAESGGATDNGTIFKIAPDGTFNVLHAFANAPYDGSQPFGDLILDKRGNLYGTTQYGGSKAGGTIFKINRAGKLTLLHSFCLDANCTDGGAPRGALVRAENGTLYGTTEEGGAGSDGTVYSLTSDGNYTVVYSFEGGDTDGADPTAGLILDKAGNLYGTTAYGGPSDYGSVFKIAADGTYSVLHFFDGTDGAYAYGGLLLDKSGNLFGATYGDTVYEMMGDGEFAVIANLYNPKTGERADEPVDSLIAMNGKLYGTALRNTGYGPGGGGAVFEVRK